MTDQQHTETHQPERQVIGSLLRDSSRLNEVDLIPEDFEDATCARIYHAILDLHAEREVIDPVTVGQHLHDVTGRLWLPIIGEIARSAFAPKNAQAYADIVRRESQRRQAIAAVEQLKATIARDGDQAIDEAVRKLMALSATRRRFEHSGLQCVTAAIDYLDEVRESGGLVGVSTGLVDLDSKLGGLHKTDLIVIAARPSMGKTAFMLNLANRCGVPCGIMSSEQASEQIGSRLIAINGKVSAHRMRTGKTHDDEWPRITGTIALMQNRAMWINDRPAPTIDEVIRQARKWAHENAIKILFVDYLQRIRGDKRLPKHERVGDCCLALKELGRELEIPVVVLAQINRNVEARENKRPGVADLKDSGEIEQEADQVLMLYRDEVYNPQTHTPGICEVIVGKNRHGPCGVIKLVWQPEYMVFESSAPDYYDQQVM